MLNDITIVGVLNDDARQNNVNGKTVANFSVRCKRDHSEGFDLLNCVAWNECAEKVINNCKKGDSVMVAGRVQPRDWTDKDGKRKVVVEIQADSVVAAKTEESYNRVTLMGRLTRDPELRQTNNGIAVASYAIAVDRDFAPNGDRKTDFIDCSAWRQTGEFVSKYFAKGRLQVLTGRLQTRSWTDKDGEKRYSAEVVVDHAYFGDSKRDNAPAKDSDDSAVPFEMMDDSETLPFT